MASDNLFWDLRKIASGDVSVAFDRMKQFTNYANTVVSQPNDGALARPETTAKPEPAPTDQPSEKS